MQWGNAEICRARARGALAHAVMCCVWRLRTCAELLAIRAGYVGQRHTRLHVLRRIRYGARKATDYAVSKTVYQNRATRRDANHQQVLFTVCTAVHKNCFPEPPGGRFF